MLGKMGWAVYANGSAFPIIHADTREAAEALRLICQQSLGIVCKIDRISVLTKQNVESILRLGLHNVVLYYGSAGLATSTKQEENIGQVLMTATTRKKLTAMVTTNGLVIIVKDFVMEDKSRMIAIAQELWEKHSCYTVLMDILTDWRKLIDSGGQTTFVNFVRQSEKSAQSPYLKQLISKDSLTNRVRDAGPIFI